MTAIAGVWHTDGRPTAQNDVVRMLGFQHQYGPDAARFWAERDVGLGRRLTRVLPEDAFDTQPLSGAGGRCYMVADVRLDNRAELADLLGLEEVSKLSDAAILLAAWVRWDEGCLDRLVGDYVFAVWDCAKRRMLLARDPMGCRPLHYFHSPRCFAFASMPRGLHALAEVPYGPDTELIAEGLLHYIPDGTRSYFRAIQKVAPGHLVRIDGGELLIRSHWHPPRQLLRLSRVEHYAEALREKLETAVRCRLRAAGGIATQLSGGLDSAAVTATAARLVPEERVIALTSVPRADFTGGESLGRFADEGAHSAAVAALYPNIEHVRVPTPPVSPIDGLDRAFELYESPLVNLCNQVWIDAINDAARDRGARVMLIGSVGNHTASFAGHELLAELLRTGRLFRLVNELTLQLRRRPRAWKGTLIQTVAPWIPAVIWRRLARRRAGAAFMLVNPECRAEVEARVPTTRSPALLHRASADSVENRIRALGMFDPANIHKGILAHWGLDYRDPFTDRRLVEFCLAVPVEVFSRGGAYRMLARSAFSDRLPPLVIEETRKGLQGADWYIGLTEHRQRLLDEVARIAASASARRLLDVEALSRTARELPSGDWESHYNSARFRASMLRTISAGHFLRRAEGPRPRAEVPSDDITVG